MHKSDVKRMSHKAIVMNITLLKHLSAAQHLKEPFHNPPAIVFIHNFARVYGLMHNGIMPAHPHGVQRKHLRRN